MRTKNIIAFALLLTLAVFAGLLTGCGRTVPVVEMAVVPELTGLTPQEAASLLQEAGLEMGETRETYDEDVPAGKIISTVPASGEELEKGSAVDLATSRGPEMIVVPALLAAAEADAITALQAQGFQVELIRAYHESVGAGLVCAMEPVPDTPVMRGTIITLTVSEGSAYVTCGTCGGDGKVTADVTCPECGGAGVCYT